MIRSLELLFVSFFIKLLKITLQNHWQLVLGTRQNIKKQVEICPTKKIPKTILIQISLRSFWMLGTIDERKKPARKAPRWPRQSISSATSLKRSKKDARRTTMKMILNLKMKPILRKAGQLIMIYPMLSPTRPQRLVEDPAFSIQSTYSKSLKMPPAIPESMYTMSTFNFPKVYSSRLTRSSKIRTLLMRCSMFTCKNWATTSRQTCPLQTLCESLMPIKVSVSQFTSSTVFDESNPSDNSTIKTTVMMRMSMAVREVMWRAGQKVFLSMTQQLSSLGSTTATFPARKSILWSSIYDIFSSVMPTRKRVLSTSSFRTLLSSWLLALL